MTFLRPWRIATWRTPYRGLQDPGVGVLILDRNPRYGVKSSGFWILLLFLFCWWCGCAFGIGAAIATWSLELLCFCLLVLGISLLILHEGVRWCFGRERIWIGPRGLDYLRIDGLVRRQRLIPFHEIHRLAQYTTMVDGGENVGLHAEHGLAIETIGRTLFVGQSRNRDDVGRLQQEVERHLREWYPAWADAPDCRDGGLLDLLMAADQPAPGQDAPECPDREILNASGMWPDPPSDSTLSCRREWDRTEFVRWVPKWRTWILTTVASLWIFLGLVFTPLISSHPSFGYFLLCLILADVFLFSAAARRHWVVRPGEISEFVGVWGIGWSRTTEIEWLDGIELRKVPGNAPWTWQFKLALVDMDDKDKVVFHPLTEGEARWIAGIVADILKDALPRIGQEVYRWSVTVDPPATGSRAMADVWLDEVLADVRPKRSARPGEALRPDADRIGSGPERK
jgi:hypothetical protein